MNSSTSPSPRRPFSLRHNSENSQDKFSLFEGVSDGLRPSLVEWIISQLCYYMHDTEVPEMSRVRRLERQINRTLAEDSQTTVEDLSYELALDDILLLDASDAMLQFSSGNDANRLESYLVDAHSAYCVGQDQSNRYQLQARQAHELAEMLQAVASGEGRAAEHLRSAWSSCFGRNSDPKAAYAEAVMAIEVAAKPVVLPNDPRATLGKICVAIRDKPEKWESEKSFDNGVETVLAMMTMIWNGQLRHGDETAPLRVPQPAAEMAIHIAVTLVSWFESGRFRLAS